MKQASVRSALMLGAHAFPNASALMGSIQQMIDEMQRRGYARKTIGEYSGSVRRLASYFGRCPSELTLEPVREYQLHLAKRKEISTSYYNATVTALRFLYVRTLGREDGRFVRAGSSQTFSKEEQ